MRCVSISWTCPYRRRKSGLPLLWETTTFTCAVNRSPDSPPKASVWMTFRKIGRYRFQMTSRVKMDILLYALPSLSRISIDPSDLIEPSSSYPDGCESFSPVHVGTGRRLRRSGHFVRAVPKICSLGRMTNFSRHHRSSSASPGPSRAGKKPTTARHTLRTATGGNKFGTNKIWGRVNFAGKNNFYLHIF